MCGPPTTLVEPAGRQLRPRRHPELDEHVAQVEVDRSRAEEKLRRGVTVGQPFSDERGDLLLRALSPLSCVKLPGGAPETPRR
jgi:hypothetical protein